MNAAYKIFFLLLILTAWPALSQSLLDDPDYKKHVDKVVKSTNKSRSLKEDLKEGEIYEKDNIVGAYSTIPLYELNTFKLHRLKYVEDSDTSTIITYYYSDNDLIFATLTRRLPKKKAYITDSKYYFRDDSLVGMEGLNAKESEGLWIIGQSERDQRDFYSTWFKEEKP